MKRRRGILAPRESAPVIQSAGRHAAIGGLQVLAGLSLLAPLLSFAVHVALVRLGLGEVPVLEVGWGVFFIGLVVVLLGGIWLVASRPEDLPIGDLTSPDDRWAL